MPTSHSHPRRPKIVIVGGGFGGLYAAKALRHAPVDITLVDRANHHLFQPLLYQVATGLLTEGEIAPALRSVLRHQANARVLLAEVTGLDAGARTVAARTPAGAALALPYDVLIVAAGVAAAGAGHATWAPVAPALKSLEDARLIRSRVLAAFEAAEAAPDAAERRRWQQFAVVGGGTTGVELAGQLAILARRTLARDHAGTDTRRARIALVEAGPDVLPELPEPLRRRARADLERLGVAVHTGCAAAWIDADGVDVARTDGTPARIGARTVLWAAGVGASPLAGTVAGATGARLDGRGRVLVGDDLSVDGHPEVFVVGDMAAVPGVPGVAPAAMQMGRHVARVVRARLRDREPRAFRYVDKGRLAVIGRHRAVGAAAGVRFHGLLAMAVWVAVHLWYLLGWGNRLITVARWSWALLARNRAERVISTAALATAETPAVAAPVGPRVLEPAARS